MFSIHNTLSFNTDKLITGVEYDYVTRTSQNQGVLQQTAFVNEENINPAGNWSLGLLQMDFFYRNKPWYAGQFVRKIVPKNQMTKNSISFFTSVLNKQKQKLLSVLVRDVDNTFLNYIIQLPTQNGKIDFDFIERFVVELEAERIKKLDAYLIENDLNDYTLTVEEEKVLADFEDGKVEFKEFKIGELFDINTYKKRFDANKVDISETGKPYVVRTALNNGIRGYINEDIQFLNDGNTISFGQDTATMFYQEKPYFTGDKIKILKSKDNRFNKLNALIFISTMTKSFSSFSWGASSFNVNIIGNQLINIPVKKQIPDYEIMKTLSIAIHKLVIKDVVLYVERKKEESKNIKKSNA